MPSRRDWLATSLPLLAAGLARAAAPGTTLDVVYPNMPERPPEAYGYRLLQLALAESGCDCSPRIAGASVSALRAAQGVFAGEANVLDVGVGTDLEARTDLVPFPLDMGLSGCRVFLVRKDVLPRVEQVQTFDQLRQFTFGQGQGWIDVQILRAAGLKVETAQFVPLFRMLEARRFDIFALGADEAAVLLSRYRAEAPSVVIAQNVALHYPFARVFAVQRGLHELHAALVRGLHRAFDNGSFKRLLAEQPGLGPIVSGAQALPARMFELRNPDATRVVDAIPPAYLHPTIRAQRQLASPPR